MISVKCPHCRVGLKVDERKIPKGVLTFKCPKCKGVIPLAPLMTPQKESSSETVVLRQGETGCGKLVVEANPFTTEQQLLLQEGRFIVGRHSASSPANLVIQTSDKQMSRSHLTLEVKKNAQGAIIHSLSDHHSKNKTLYNGVALTEGEVVVLKNNDRILIGQTTLIFVL